MCIAHHAASRDAGKATLTVCRLPVKATNEHFPVQHALLVNCFIINANMQNIGTRMSEKRLCPVVAIVLRSSSQFQYRKSAWQVLELNQNIRSRENVR